jgi:hypothetical protein
MHKNRTHADLENRTNELVRLGAEAELSLLKQERKSEERLAAAQERLAQDELRLRKAEKRLERSREAVRVAAESLRECQARRAIGPDFAES